MYGLIVEIEAVSGQGQALADILDRAFSELPGMLSYLVSSEAANSDKIWVAESWDSRDSHAAALTSDRVAKAMEAGKPLIAKLVRRIETTPL